MEEESNIRAFIAINLDQSVREACTERINALRKKPWGRQVHWRSPEKLHITLQFFEALPTSQIYQLQNKLYEFTQQHSQFKLQSNDIIYFPSKSTTNIIGLSFLENIHLNTFHSNLQQVLQQLSLVKSMKKYTPHLTLGHCKQALDVRHERYVFKAKEIRVEKIVLIKSHLEAPNSEYETLFNLTIPR